MNKTPAEIRAELDFHFYEGRSYPARPGKDSLLMTSGVVKMMELCHAGWLVEKIVQAQFSEPHKSELFQVWKLVVRPDRSAQLLSDDGNGKIITQEEISRTDFPLSEGISLFLTNGVIMLPSEY